MNKHFLFEHINLDVFAKGKFILEQQRVSVTEIRIGVDLHNEFLKIAMGPAVHRTLIDEASQQYEFKVLGIEIKFPIDKDVYYMKPDEILFLSIFDHLYARGRKI